MLSQELKERVLSETVFLPYTDTGIDVMESGQRVGVVESIAHGSEFSVGTGRAIDGEGDYVNLE